MINIRNNIKKILSSVVTNTPTELFEIERTEEKIGIIFPDGYKELMLHSDGLEGSIGDSAYLVLWKLEEIFELNREYCVQEFAPGLVLFGTDGGDTAYAFDCREVPARIVSLPFIGMALDQIVECGTTFNEFLKYVEQKSNED